MHLRSVAIGGALCLTLAACGERAVSAPEESMTPATSAGTANAEAYLPTWLTPEQNERIANIAPQLGGVTIAFALPSAAGEVQAPVIEDIQSFKRIIGALPTEATVSLAIGGWGGDDAAHKAILQGFKNGAAHPETFVKSTEQVMQTLEEQIGHEVKGIDIDWEYPTVADAEGFTTLLTTLKRELPNARLSIAAPAYDTPASRGINTALRQPKVRSALDRVHVMTYDQHGPWEKTAGVVASGAWAKTSIKNWVEVMGEAKVSPGYATYCYEYKGAKAEGQAFAESQEHAFSELPKGTRVSNNKDTLTSATKINGNWTSCQSPQVVRALDGRLRRVYPGLASGFFWDANGLTKAYVDK